MDIRDIKGEVKYPRCGLTEIFELQKKLVEPYIKIEGLPMYPIDLNTKSSQVLLKDFIGRVIEELGEAWESYEIMMEGFQTGAPDHMLVAHLQNYNEEVADAIHFFIELLIYVGITPEEIRNHFQTSHGPVFEDILDGLLYVGNFELQKDLRYSKRIASYTLIPDKELKDEFLRGGRKLGNTHYQLQKELLWDITYQLQIARNTLKNKPWKQTGMMTDETLFIKYMGKALVALFKFFYFTGFTKESIFTIYYKKNKVNQFRQKSKY